MHTAGTPTGNHMLQVRCSYFSMPLMVVLYTGGEEENMQRAAPKRAEGTVLGRWK